MTEPQEVILKNGKVKYRIQVKITDPITKDVKFHCATWHNPDNIPRGKKAYHAACAFGNEFEKDIRSGKVQTFLLNIPTFRELADEWLYLNKSVISDNYYLRASRTIDELNDEWGDKKINDFAARDVQMYFAKLSNKKYKTVTAVLKPEIMENFYKIVEAHGFKKACEKDSFSWATLFSARKGDSIRWNSAEAICKKFNINVNEFFEKISIEKPYKKETIKGYQRVLSSIFEHGVQSDLLPKNYALSKYVKKNIGGKGVDEVEVLSKKEQARLIEVLEKSPIADSIPIFLMLYLGLRKCEMCGLNWSDIDFENRIISIKNNRVYVPRKGIIKKALKTEKSKRDLHIITPLLAKLHEYKRYFDWLRKDDPTFDASDAVYCNYDGTPRNPGHVDILLKRFLAEANCHDISGHKLRHTWITTLISEGTPINIVSKMAGHSNADTTLKVYTHYSRSADNSKDVLERVFSRHSNSEPNWDFAG